MDGQVDGGMDILYIYSDNLEKILKLYVEPKKCQEGKRDSD